MNSFLPDDFDASDIKDPRLIAAVRLLIRQQNQVGFLSTDEFNVFSPEWKEFLMAVKAYTGPPPIDDDLGIWVMCIIIIIWCFLVYSSIFAAIFYYFWTKQPPKKSSDGEKGTTGSPA